MYCKHIGLNIRSRPQAGHHAGISHFPLDDSTAYGILAKAQNVLPGNAPACSEHTAAIPLSRTMKKTAITALGLAFLAGCSSDQKGPDDKTSGTEQMTRQEANFRKTNAYMDKLKKALAECQSIYLASPTGNQEWLTQEDTQKIRDILTQAQPDYNQEGELAQNAGTATTTATTTADTVILHLANSYGNSVSQMPLRPAFGGSNLLVPVAPIRFTSATLESSMSSILSPMRQRLLSAIPEPPPIIPPTQPREGIQPPPPQPEPGKPPVAVPVPGNPLEVYSPYDSSKTIRILNRKTGQRQPSGKKLYDPYSPNGKGIFIVP